MAEIKKLLLAGIFYQAASVNIDINEKVVAPITGVSDIILANKFFMIVVNNAINSNILVVIGIVNVAIIYHVLN
jgi:hypothetical protein